MEGCVAETGKGVHRQAGRLFAHARGGEGGGGLTNTGQGTDQQMLQMLQPLLPATAPANIPAMFHAVVDKPLRLLADAPAADVASPAAASPAAAAAAAAACVCHTRCSQQEGCRVSSSRVHLQAAGG
jgi:hypothetical protein